MIRTDNCHAIGQMLSAAGLVVLVAGIDGSREINAIFGVPVGNFYKTAVRQFLDAKKCILRPLAKRFFINAAAMRRGSR